MKNIIDYIKNVNEGNEACYTPGRLYRDKYQSGIKYYERLSLCNDPVSRSYNNLFSLSNTLCRKVTDGLWIATGSPLRNITTGRTINIDKIIFGSAAEGTRVTSGSCEPVTISSWAMNRGMGIYYPNGYAAICCCTNDIVAKEEDTDNQVSYDRLCPQTMDIIRDVTRDEDFIVICAPQWVRGVPDVPEP